MEIISLKGPHRIVRFARSDGGGDGYWYRSETLFRGASLGSTYGTLAEAERDFMYTILHDTSKKGG
jgi:hypothetical protein